ncbi:hypothetical protein [Paraburkholderia sp. BCC1886]|uniref:hypothetical protein n=1 Tax=Paraburkholderia sp. BCC1886 TaxID=2562670 RepID=UPI0011820981|nr:hypothetical protein [Paraburkholderia sp. BCC1886]
MTIPIRDYTESVKALAGDFDTDPHAMLSWLACYVSTKANAGAEIWNAVADISYSTSGVPDDQMEIFMEAADALGGALIEEFAKYGVYTREDETFPYEFHGVMGKSVVFRRYTDNRRLNQP